MLADFANKRCAKPIDDRKSNSLKDPCHQALSTVKSFIEDSTTESRSVPLLLLLVLAVLPECVDVTGKMVLVLPVSLLFAETCDDRWPGRRLERALEARLTSDRSIAD